MFRCLFVVFILILMVKPSFSDHIVVNLCNETGKDLAFVVARIKPDRAVIRGFHDLPNGRCNDQIKIRESKISLFAFVERDAAGQWKGIKFEVDAAETIPEWAYTPALCGPNPIEYGFMVVGDNIKDAIKNKCAEFVYNERGKEYETISMSFGMRFVIDPDAPPHVKRITLRQ